jgi:hypothetical protein
MPLSPDLFDSIKTPSVWVTLQPPLCDEADTRLLTLRIQEQGHRSISAAVEVSRYAPEYGCLRAVADAIDTLQHSQLPIDRALLIQVLDKGVEKWVEPF